MLDIPTGYTPGPWRAFIDDSGDNRWSGWPLSVESVNEEDKTVVRTGGQWPYEWDAKTSQHEAVANARLIALAPDMVAEIERLREASIGCAAALAAAISLLERGGRKAAPSDRMFAQMLEDYRRALADTRAALATPAQEPRA